MLSTRLLIGSSLIAALVFVIWFDERIARPILSSGIILLFTIVAQDELVKMARGHRPGFWIIVQGTAAAVIGLSVVSEWRGWTTGPTEITLHGIVLGLALVLIQKVIAFERGTRDDLGDHIRDVAVAALSLLYVVAPMTMLLDLMYLAPGGKGTRFACAVVLISKCGDMGGYLVGTFMGKRRIFPRVSPKKSYEGSTAGLFLTVVATLLLAPYFPWLTENTGIWALLAFAVVVNLMTQAGDFAESMLKRTCGVKDSAALLPTFGGALDIIDSLVFAVPAAHLLVRIAGVPGV